MLHTSCEWKLCEFFTAIGQRKHGEKLMPRWNEVPGAQGRCRVSVETFRRKDGSEGQANRVKAFLESLDASIEGVTF